MLESQVEVGESKWVGTIDNGGNNGANYMFLSAKKESNITGYTNIC